MAPWRLIRLTQRARLLWQNLAGVAAVEFAIVAPVLLLFILGTLVYGLYFGMANSVQQLASEAARASVAGITEQERGDLARSLVRDALPSYGLLRSTYLQVSAAFDPADPDLFRVTLSYDASYQGLSAFARILPSPPDQIQRSASIRRGGA